LDSHGVPTHDYQFPVCLYSAVWNSADWDILRPLYGKLSDIFGRKSCLIFSYTVFAIGCLLCGLSRNLNELVASRAFAGVGGAGMQTYVIEGLTVCP